MKKFFAFLMIVALASSLSAEVYYHHYFNRNQFQPYRTLASESLDQLTVPFAYEGTISINGYQAFDDDLTLIEKDVAEAEKANDGEGDCVVESVRGNIPVFMTICQPCMDCFPCTEMLQKKLSDNLPYAIDAKQVGDDSISGYLTRWNLYLVSLENGTDRTGAEVEYATIYKYDMINEVADAGEADETVFYTGRKRGNAYVQAVSALGNFAMIGQKADYYFRFYPAVLKDTSSDKQHWVSSNKSEQTAYVKSVASFEGNYCMATLLGSNEDVRKAYASVPALFGFQLCGTINLSRNTSVTEQLLSDAFGVKEESTQSDDNWEECKPVTTQDASWCEAIISSRSLGDNFDKWLAYDRYRDYEENDRLEFKLGDASGIAKVLDTMVLQFKKTR